jgi:hypothetical protein
MHPLAFAPCRYDASVPQIREVPGNLRLRASQNLYEVADADFLLSHHVEQPEAGRVSESLKELWQIEGCVASHAYRIRVDEYVCNTYICLDKYVGGGAWQILESVRSKYGAVAESTFSSNDAGVKAVAEAFGRESVRPVLPGHG